MQIIKKLFLSLAIGASLSLVGFSVYQPTAVHATAISESKKILSGSSKTSGLDDSVSIIVIVAGVINQIIGVLGVVAVALVVYAGGLWLTAAGNDTKVATAKKIIVRTVIGTIIIGLAYAITAFIFSSIVKVPEKTKAAASGAYSTEPIQLIQLA